MANLTDLMTRNYSSFKGVDFTGGIVANYRSPDALNMYRNYKDDDCVQTRPGMELLNKFDNEIYGLFFFKVLDYTHVLVHCGTKMLEWTNYPITPATIKELYTGLNPKQSRYFIYDGTFFFMDGINYLEFDGNIMKAVEGTIPITSYYKNPDGSTTIDTTTDTDLVYQPINVLTSLRKNMFIADGKSKTFQLDTIDLDLPTKFLTKAYINNTEYVENINFSVDRTKGIITFNEVFTKETEIIILFSKTTQGYKERILNCNLSCEFDNRIFFSGNKDYPNAVFHSELNDPRYIRDTAYYECGADLANIKSIFPGSNSLWVIKEMNQNNSSVYYMTPTLDATYNKIYPSVNGNISLGCVSIGTNFNDDLVFFSRRGLEGINTNLYSEQILSHRSSNIDSKLLSEENYEDIKVTEYDGYLMCLINSHIYLADSRQKFQNISNDIEYEWFYWELPYNICFITEYRGMLYLGNSDGELFKLNGTKDKDVNIYSYWTTRKDDFNCPSYLKTTNKRGNVVRVKKMNNNVIKLDTIVDDILKEKKVYDDTKGTFAFRIKDKKFKEIQIKISSNKPFGLFSCTLQGFVAGYVKR